MVQHQVVSLCPPDRHLPFEFDDALNAEVDVVDLERFHDARKRLYRQVMSSE
jgi:hypothetical protein